MKNLTIRTSKLNGEINIIASKSLSHRYLIAASLANGISNINNVLDSKDIEATSNILSNLGVNINVSNNNYTVESKGLINNNKELYCNESGSTMRFFIPLCWTIKGESIISGTNYLGSRSISVYEDIAKEFNYKFEKNNNNFPFIIEGPLKSGNYLIDGNVSSQFITGLLFSLPLVSGDSRIEFKTNIASKGYINLTLDVLKESGIIVEEINNGYFIKGNQNYLPINKNVEGDYSQAAFFIVAAIITNSELIINNLNINSLQGDKEILTILINMGANIIIKNNKINILKNHNLKPMTVDLYDIPDLGPILMVLASTQPFETKFTNIDRLFDKESNRVLAIKDNLEKLDVEFILKDNELIIKGRNSFNKEIEFNTYNDHRIAMALSVFALINKKDTKIKDYEVINKSYPTFYEELIKLGGNVIYDK